MPYKEKNGKWRGHRMIDGKRRTKRFKTKTEAKKWESGQNHEKWEEEMILMASLSLLDWANEYLDYAKQRFTEKTYKEDKKVVFRRFFKAVSPEKKVKDLRVPDCLAFLGKQARKRSGNAANKDRKNLMAAWTWGTKYLGLPSENPFRAVDKYPADARPRYVPPEDDFWRVYEVARDEDKVFLLTMLHTAARRKELLRLRWDDVDLLRGKYGKIQLGTRKRASGSLGYDWLPLTERLREALLKHKKNARSVYVFCDESGQPYKWRQHLMATLSKRAGVKLFGFHAIRHLSASILAQAGVDIPTIQTILRHKNSLTTSRYIKQLGVIENVLERVFGGRGKVLEMKTPEAVNFRG